MDLAPSGFLFMLGTPNLNGLRLFPHYHSMPVCVLVATQFLMLPQRLWKRVVTLFHKR